VIGIGVVTGSGSVVDVVIGIVVVVTGSGSVVDVVIELPTPAAVISH
jgi:hypothetical protein